MLPSERKIVPLATTNTNYFWRYWLHVVVKTTVRSAFAAAVVATSPNVFFYQLLLQSVLKMAFGYASVS